MKLLVLLTLLFSFTLQASPKRYCTEFENLPVIRIDVDKPNNVYNCDDFRVFDQILYDIKELSPVEIPRLNYVVVSNPPYWNAFYNGVYNNITFSFDRTDPDELSTIDKIFAHELGHFIFQKMLSNLFPEYKELLRLNDLVARQTELMRPAFRKYEEKNSPCTDQPEICNAMVEEAFARAHSDISNATENRDQYADINTLKLNHISDLVGPYHELFADLVASILFEDPDVNALRKYSGEDRTCRTFSKELGSDFKTVVAHCAFSKIRKRLWNQVVIPQIKDKKSLILFIGQVFLEEIRSNKETFIKLDQKEVDRLVESLGRAFNL